MVGKADTIEKLYTLAPGERLVYHRGPTVEGCSERVREVVAELLKNGRVRCFQRRETNPTTHNRIVDWKHGVGTFEYIVEGR